MLKTYEVMTQSLATCAPDATVTEVAEIMRDRNIGNVLVVENGKLCGIVTDRDLALQSLTGKDNPSKTPISQYMSTKIITGEASWELKQVAQVMAKNQIRRLPILQDGKLVGIVSLGDVALNEERNAVVSNSLQAISTPSGNFTPRVTGRAGALIGVGLVALASTAIAWLTWSHSGQVLRKQMLKSDIYRIAQDAARTAREKVDEAASSKLGREIRHQVHANLKELSEHLPSLEFKPAKS